MQMGHYGNLSRGMWEEAELTSPRPAWLLWQPDFRGIREKAAFSNMKARLPSEVSRT